MNGRSREGELSMMTFIKKNSYRWSIITFVVVIIFGSAGAKVIAGEKRTIHFPKDRSIGELYVRNRDFPTGRYFSEWLGQAKGDVTVPADKFVRLDVSEDAWQGGMPFVGLKPDDIQELNFYKYLYADDSVLEDISTLSGLQELDLQDAQILGTGLKHLGKLKKLKWLRLPSTHVGDNELASLVGLTSLEVLNLGGALIGNAGMEHISKIKTLKSLYLHSTSLDDDGLEHIKNLTFLRKLDLGRNYIITDEGLKQLAGLTELEELNLQETQISGAGLVHLRQMKKLKKLHLFKTKVGDEGLKHIRHLESLEYLQLPVYLFTTDAVLAKLSEQKALVTDAGLAQLSELKALKHLFILNDSITEKGLGTLAKLQSLEELNTGGRNINDAGMAKLAKFLHLKKLWIQHSAVTDDGLAKLKDLKSLTYLSIRSSTITGEGLVFLQELPNLVELELWGTDLGHAGLSALAGITSLERLTVDDTKINDDDLAGLSELKHLKRLNISSDEISDEGIRHLARLKSLESLSLRGSGITNAGLAYLEGLDLLKNLELRRTKVTEEGLQRLKKKLPALRWHLDQDSLSIQPPSLVGKPLLKLKDFKLNLSLPESNEKKILVCFFDMNQRPSRNCLWQLSKRAPELKAKDVVVVAVQASKVEENSLNEWVKKYSIPFPVGMVQGNEEKTRFDWGVKSLPWLILTDQEHIVRSNGFSLAELNEKIQSAKK